ncbi:hypothetical protein [Roseomonas populi]|uniref:Uncharacterized protein n=1 Tax=Roseomonas populi TaxID=3121582 RepID=A0ABT1X735_9PROT|nr:hypothetical protein [Roseomonas pecuniae]MCR0983915.1 hypothetical protein [Roseomonas pecuniae]
MERRTRGWTLHRGGRGTPGEVLRKLTRAIMGVCLWDPQEEGVSWALGDMRFLTVSAMLPDMGEAAYAQVFSAPYASSAVEVASGRFAARGAFAKLPVSARKRASVLKELGLTLPPQGREDWSRDLPPLDEAGCASLARTVLEALTGAFGWTPDVPLQASVIHETALGETEAFMEGLRPIHVEGLLREAGLEIVEGEPEDDDSAPAFLVQHGAPLPFQVELTDPVEEEDPPALAWHYGTIVFSLAINVEEGDALALALALHALTRWARVELPEEKRVVVSRLDGVEGVTPEGLRAMLDRWLEELTAVRSRLEQGPPEMREEED